MRPQAEPGGAGGGGDNGFRLKGAAEPERPARTSRGQLALWLSDAGRQRDRTRSPRTDIRPGVQ